MSSTCKKLIEVAMPVKEISAESVRDKSIRHGHISTLHLWWARRPLPVCRAVVFASLVPDPLDENCPQAFRDAVKELLGQPFALETKAGYEEYKQDWYKPYTDIPYTAAHDLMEDNLRNRLLMFIGKYSDKYVENERAGKTSNPKDQLSEASLIKWESRHNDTIITIARKLIWVAHNAAASEAKKSPSAAQLLKEFDTHYATIKQAEQELYGTKDRHLLSKDVTKKEEQLHKAIEAFLDRMPKVFDPFAGGGAIPLEASRLGCRSFGNDINPVAHIIQKGSLEFPQKYGKPITYSKVEFEKIYGEETFKNLPGEWKKVEDGETKAVRIPNRLSFDVKFFAKELLKRADDRIGNLYNGIKSKPIAYYWARIATCSNPSCRAEVPLLKEFYLCNKPDKQIYLNPIFKGKEIEFEIKKGAAPGEAWVHSRKNLRCPICGNNTSNQDLKSQFIYGSVKE
jgi:putative DNA methylase